MINRYIKGMSEGGWGEERNKNDEKRKLKEKKRQKKKRVKKS